MATPGGHDASRRDLSAPWRHIDPILLVCTIAVGALGTVMVFSATRGNAEVADTTFVKKQLLFMVIGVGVMLLVAVVDYRRYQDYAYFAYGATCFLLFLVISPLGKSSKGAQAWFQIGGFQLQPSEFSKLALIVGLSALLAHWRGDIDLRRFGVALMFAGLPMGLIMKQPDLGTALVFVAVMFALLLIGMVPARYLLVLVLLGSVAVPLALSSSVLQQYQKDRLTTFLDPQQDRSGTAYNLNQSIITISRGRLGGDGLFQGKQTQLRFVPEQQTDFIFTVVGEELGFVGGATFLGLMAVIIWRIWRTAALARDQFGQLVCVGVMGMFVFQIFESVGMAMGIMPVTGIPLPFMSYGGSTTLACFAGVGLVLNVHMRRFR